jgi:hypothetical protein
MANEQQQSIQTIQTIPSAAPLAALGETAVSASVAQAEAMVKARVLMALQRPRDWEVVRERFLRECSRPALAEIAIYRKPVGDGIEGPSIRLAEVALRCMTNVLIRTPVVYDDADKRVVRVEVMDLESNATYEKEVTITKQVERRNVPRGQTPIASRTNSRGDKVYILQATDDDILNKENALISKAMRTLGFRIFPGYLLEEGTDKVREVLKAGATKDPDAEKRKVIDAFSAQGVNAAALSDYLGHPLDTIAPAEIVELRGVYQAIKDGEASWADTLEHKRAQRAAFAGGEDGAPKKSTLADKAKAAAEKAKASSPAPAPAAERVPGQDDGP